MAWSAPMTATANAIFTASQFNTYVRDNLLETAPAKASTAGGYFVATGTNAISQRTCNSQYISASGTTTSTTYTSTLSSGGAGLPLAVTVTTGTTAFVSVGALAKNSSTTESKVGFIVSGASSIAGTDANAFSVAGTNNVQGTWGKLITGLTAGSNTFTMAFRVTGGTGTFNNYNLSVIPF